MGVPRRQHIVMMLRGREGEEGKARQETGRGSTAIIAPMNTNHNCLDEKKNFPSSSQLPSTCLEKR